MNALPRSRRWPTLVFAPMLFLFGWSAVYFFHTTVHQEAVWAQASAVSHVAYAEQTLRDARLGPSAVQPLGQYVSEKRAGLSAAYGMVAARWGTLIKLVWITYLSLFAGTIVLHIGCHLEKEQRRAEARTARTPRQAEARRTLPDALVSAAPVSPAKPDAFEAERFKEAIFANVNHEMRTPLTVILGYASILETEVAAEQRALVQAIQQGGERLLGTLNDFLDLAELDADRIDLDLAALDLRRATMTTLQHLQSSAQAKGLRLAYQGPASPVTITADREAIGRVVHHLLDNAIKFTHKGVVQLHVEAVGETARLHIRDTGTGIDEVFLPKLFDAFRQESDGVTRNYGGIGIGLTITQQLIKKMGGTIAVESEKGKGTCFTVSFPLAVSQRRTLRLAA